MTATLTKRYPDGTELDGYERVYGDGRDVVLILRDAHNTILWSRVVRLPNIGAQA